MVALVSVPRQQELVDRLNLLTGTDTSRGYGSRTFHEKKDHLERRRVSCSKPRASQCLMSKGLKVDCQISVHFAQSSAP